MNKPVAMPMYLKSLSMNLACSGLMLFLSGSTTFVLVVIPRRPPHHPNPILQDLPPAILSQLVATVVTVAEMREKVKSVDERRLPVQYREQVPDARQQVYGDRRCVDID